MGRGTRAVMLTTALAGTGVLIGSSIGSAQAPTTQPNWNCRASLIRVDQGLTDLLGLPASPVEPLLANGRNSATAPDNPACLPDSQSAQERIDVTPLTVVGDVLKAETTVTPGLGVARNTRTNTATTSAEKLNLLIQSAIPGGVLVTADAVQSTASASCVAGVPTLTGSSQVTNLRIAGNAIPLDSVLDGIAVPLTDSPLGAVAKVYVNRQETSTAADGSKALTQTALRIEVLGALADVIGKPLATVVLGESRVSSQNGNACDAEPPPPTVTVPGPTTTVPGPTTTVPGPTTTVPGPTQTVPVPVPVTVTTPGSVSGAGTSPVRNGTNGGCGRLTMFFAKNRRKTLGVRFGQERVVTRGRIVNCSGKSIVRARIDVFHVLPGGTKRLVKTGLRSRELGRLTQIMPRNLFTRKLVFEYRGDLSSSRVTSRQTLQINVRDARGKLVTRAPKGQGKPKF